MTLHEDRTTHYRFGLLYEGKHIVIKVCIFNRTSVKMYISEPEGAPVKASCSERETENTFC